MFGIMMVSISLEYVELSVMGLGSRVGFLSIGMMTPVRKPCGTHALDKINTDDNKAMSIDDFAYIRCSFQRNISR